MINVSIIIPHYNSASLLEKLLLSIPKQKDIEIIVIDDKSDQEVEKLKELKNDNRFKHVLFLDNDTLKKGAGTCRNLGLEFAQGKWLLFADSDDFFTENFYDTIRKYFQSNYDIIYFKPTSVYIDSNQKSTRHLLYNRLIDNYRQNQSIENEIRLRYQYPVPWSKLIKSKLVYESNILFDEVIAMNDIMFSTKVGYYANKIYASDETIYCVTRSGGSLTTKMNEKVIDSRIESLIRYKRFIDQNLSHEHIKFVNFSSLYELQRIYYSGLGLNKVIEAYCRFKKHNINLLKLSMFNPLAFYKRTKSAIQRVKSEKKYYKK